MPYTTMRNSPFGGKVIVRKQEIEIVSPDNLHVTFTIAPDFADFMGWFLKHRSWEFETDHFTVHTSKNLSGVRIPQGDEAIIIRLKKRLGDGDLMIVSRRGFLRAARLAEKDSLLT